MLLPRCSCCFRIPSYVSGCTLGDRGSPHLPFYPPAYSCPAAVVVDAVAAGGVTPAALLRRLAGGAGGGGRVSMSIKSPSKHYSVATSTTGNPPPSQHPRGIMKPESPGSRAT